MNNAEMQNEIQEKIDTLIEESTNDMNWLLARSDYDLQGCYGIYECMPEDLMEQLDYYNQYQREFEIVNYDKDIARYKKTQKMQLMKLSKKYVVTDEPLVSPAGFHPSELIFKQTPIAIHMDEKPTTDNVPASNVKLMVNKASDLVNGKAA